MTGARLNAMLHAVHGFIDDFRQQVEQLTREVQFPLITSSHNRGGVMRRGRFVCHSVNLSVCLYAASRKNLCVDLHEFFFTKATYCNFEILTKCRYQLKITSVGCRTT